MKKRIVLLSVLLQVAAVSLLAQSKPKAGDVISGVVSDSEGPMMLVNVVERDQSNRIVAHGITDIEGNFSFRLVNPDHRIEVSYVGYETVDFAIDKLYYEVKLKEKEDLPKVLIFDGDSDDVIPLNSNRNPTKDRMGLTDPDSWTFEYLQKNAPEGYVGGFVVNNPQGDNIYRLFLIKNKKKYELVKIKRDYKEVIEISKKRAKQLIESMDNSFTEAQERKEAEAKRASNTKNNGIQSIVFYDGNYIYAMKPGMMGVYWSGESIELPDTLWNDEAGKFQ